MAKRRLWTASLWVLMAATVPLGCGDDEAEVARLEQDEIDDDLETALESDTAVPTFGDTAVGATPDEPRRRSDAGRSTDRPDAEAPTTGSTGTGSTSGERRQPQPIVRTVPIGTTFAVYLDDPLSTETSRPGDPFTATLRDPLVGPDGHVLLPTGAKVRGRVTDVAASDRAGDTAVIKLAFEAVSFDGRSHPMRAAVVEAHPERRTRTTTGESAAKVAAGAAAGAVLGQILGHDTESTLKGAAVGAAAGTAIALGTADVDAVLPGGSRMVIRLDAPVEVQVP